MLKGAVCGHENVGKSSLMHRLRGEEHIDTKPSKSTRKKKKRMMALIPWTMESRPDSNTFNSSHATVTAAATAADTDTTTATNSTDRQGAVQLHIVERHEEDYSTLIKKSPIDFIIFLIDRTQRDSLDYVLGYLDSIVQFQNDQDDTIEVSICILLNHYDAMEKISNNDDNHNNATACSNGNENGNGNENEKGEEHANDSSLTNTTLSLQQVQGEMDRKKFKSLSPIHCIDACMNNGYGIEALNSFISLPYLKGKERDLAMQLEVVRENLKDWKSGFENKAFVSFDELEEHGKQKIPTPVSKDYEVGYTRPHEEVGVDTVVKDDPAEEKPSTPQQHEGSGGDGDNPNAGDKSQLQPQKIRPEMGRRSIMPRVENDNDGTSQAAKSSSKKTSSKKRRKGKQSRDKKTHLRDNDNANHKHSGLRPGHRSRQEISRNEKRRRTPVVYSDPKQALEAFLASDDDSDEGDTGTVTGAPTYESAQYVNLGNFRNLAVLDSDSDDSSIEVSGHRAFEQIKSVVPTRSVGSAKTKGARNAKDDSDSEDHREKQLSAEKEVTEPSVVKHKMNDSKSKGSVAEDAEQAPGCDQDSEDDIVTQMLELDTLEDASPAVIRVERNEEEAERTDTISNSDVGSLITDQKVKQKMEIRVGRDEENEEEIGILSNKDVELNVTKQDAKREMSSTSPISGRDISEKEEENVEDRAEVLSGGDAGYLRSEQETKEEVRYSAAKERIAKDVGVVSQGAPEQETGKEGHLASHTQCKEEQENSHRGNEDDKYLPCDTESVNDSDSADGKQMTPAEASFHNDNDKNNESPSKNIDEELKDCDLVPPEDEYCKIMNESYTEDSDDIENDSNQNELADLVQSTNREKRLEHASSAEASQSLESCSGDEAQLRTDKNNTQLTEPSPPANIVSTDLESDSDDGFIIQDIQDNRMTRIKAHTFRKKDKRSPDQSRTASKQEMDPHVNAAIREALLVAQKEAENALREQTKLRKSKKAKKYDSSEKKKKKKKKASKSTI